MTAGGRAPASRRWSHRPASAPRRPRPGERGSVLFIVALSLSVLVTCTALTVDLGRVSGLRRDLQNVADAVALDLVRLVDGRTAAEVVGDPRWQATLDASLERNGFTPSGSRTVVVAVGSYDPVVESFTPASGSSVPRAVRVVATDHLDHAFAPGGTTTRRQAVASQQAAAGLRLGSFAARLDSGRSALLQGLVGDALGVSAVSYQGLAGGSVGLGDLATELGLSLGSADEVARASVALVDVVRAQAEVLRRGGDTARAALLDQVALALPAPSTPVAAGDLVALVGGGEEAAAAARLDALELLTATAFVANGSAFLDVPSVALGVPGVATTTSRLRIVEQPVLAFGPVGTSARTAQLRLETSVAVSVAGLASVTVALAVDVASATATIADVGCRSPQRLVVDVATGLATARADVTARVLASVPVLGSVSVADVVAHATTTGTPTAEALTFEVPPDELGVPRPYAGPALDLGGAAVVLDSTTQIGSLPIGVALGPLVSTVLTTVVGPTLEALDTALVRPLLDLLGAAAPGADVTPLAITCGDRGLVA